MGDPFNIEPRNAIYKPKSILFIVLSIIISSYLIYSFELLGSALFIGLIFLIVSLYVIFRSPIYGLITVFIVNFFVLGLTRYIPAPLGLSVDILLILTTFALFIRGFNYKVNWNLAVNELTLIISIWFLYTLFQLFNPETQSYQAWFYAMRGMALYIFLTIPLTFILFNKHTHLSNFLIALGFFSVLGSLKGIMQNTIGLDPFEQKWLDNGGNVTHILFGKLRVFSFFSDAGQFGGTQGHSSVIFSILALNTKQTKKKLFYIIVALLALYGMAISGTRGSIAIPLMGFSLYILLKKNFKIFILGLILGASLFIFFKYTNIGQANYEIRRIRSAFDPNNASLQVRIENQMKLKAYLADKPFGGGIGSSGNWGKRFSPNSTLANIPTDSWYVAVWAEQGVVGLILHLSILLFIIIKGWYLISKKVEDKELKAKLQALLSGMFGVMVASYGNGVLGQMPTGIIVYMSMAFIFQTERFQKQINKI